MAIREDSRIGLRWDTLAFTGIDPFSGQADFEGFKVYRVTSGAEPVQIGQWDLANGVTGEVTRDDGTPFDLGSDTGLEEIIIRDESGLVVAFEYVLEDPVEPDELFYAVVAYDRGIAADEGGIRPQVNPINLLVDVSGNVVYRSRNVSNPGLATVRSDSEQDLPRQTELHPNPFSASTTFVFELHAANDVELTVHDVLGRQVATLVSKRYEAGHHKVDWQPTDLRSGTYFVRLRAGEHSAHQKLIVLR